MAKRSKELSRRDVLKGGAIAGAGLVGSKVLGAGSAMGQLTPVTDCGVREVWATTPFIVNPFDDANRLPQPLAYRPGWRTPQLAAIVGPDPTVPADDANAWVVRKRNGEDVAPVKVVPSPGEQDVYHNAPGLGPRVHQVWPNANGPNSNRLLGGGVYPNPVLYHIRLQVGEHRFTNSPVIPISRGGRPLRARQLQELAAGGALINPNAETQTLPPSTIYGFNGGFPGPMINADYGKPVLIRFENDLDVFPPAQAQLQITDEVIARSDFGAPDFAFLTHLHNGHTAPESDGNPHHMTVHEGGYIPRDWVDNLYLNYPAGGDPREIQSFLWFHDHRMHHTGSNVYKGMVGLFPIYDTGIRDAQGAILPGTGLDPGDETNRMPALGGTGTGLGLPGRKTVNPDGTFDVKYDIPMALYDCRLDDGLTPHADFHIDPALCGQTHPEQWGRTFFRYAPNHGFVGDLFTVNCVAFPVLHVEPRKYRFRFLGASIARIYELCLMTSTTPPQGRPGTLGQYQLPNGVLWKQNAWIQIASMGGLLPQPIPRNSFELWPATRVEVVVDFSTATQGQVIYLTNVLDMSDGRKPKPNNPRTPLDRLRYKVPMLKIIVDQPVEFQDESVVPQFLRPAPLPLPANVAAATRRSFELHRSGKFGTENQWLINGLPFDPLVPLATPALDSDEVWTLINGGGGWVHPMHMHQEEHMTLARDGVQAPDARHPDDTGKADVANLDPGEEVVVYRWFRTFTGNYVAHCHNLAHEDHNMMFGFTIV